ncbi:tRNA threonylcarbamoyl adenosine modification protein YeaZ [Desulfobaculum xiamenense]|uniref:tRNA threonylcarbamoyl adenosine modification protein YeaZ n=1 Tax=Desulfobaculum xiamenense TaxID=995050 RepID=A0A846QQW5_9BACT|nr:tRNA (adenosine(37)-N6)-threonylcarbamoyltransferase complex dimerization subunit type 1 TsaB [Desulfobaculum xiamenense]NJB67594.1 tRNA threonylcarbamoyl adenosine modification protein YeaZ [Desulfobaculum xiamenense]
MGKPKAAPRFDEPVLILDGTEDRLQLVLAQDGMVGAAQAWTVPGRAMQFLAPALKALLDGMDLTPRNLSGVACVRGPGSFTGLRMILATALGMSRAAQIPTAGLDYLPLLAAGPAPLVSGTVAVITHSRTRQVYMQAFCAHDLTALAPAVALSLEDAQRALDALPRPLHILGSGIDRNGEFFAEHAGDAIILPVRFNHLSPEVLAEAACAADFTLAPIEPLYLRASDAEDNLRTIAAGRGLDPDDAARRLMEATTSVKSPDCQPTES